jgi:hypothetical protein
MSDANHIVDRLEAQFHEDADSFRSVQFWVGKVKRRREDLHHVQRSERCPTESLTAQTKVILDEKCFVSAQSIAETLQMSNSTVLKHLHEDRSFQSFYLQEVPHLLTPGLKEQRRTYAAEMIAFLLSAHKDGWHHLVTGDKSFRMRSRSVNCARFSLHGSNDLLR